MVCPPTVNRLTNLISYQLGCHDTRIINFDTILILERHSGENIPLSAPNSPVLFKLRNPNKTDLNQLYPEFYLAPHQPYSLIYTLSFLHQDPCIIPLEINNKGQQTPYHAMLKVILPTFSRGQIIFTE